jgi:[protein-PII] uridylyltransferase
MRQPRGITHELRRMNRYGVLAAYIPVFGHIVGQMQYDLFHIYTVDVHTLFLVRNLRRFTVPEFAGEFPRCSQIAETIPKPELLYLSGLFHDIAKGRGGDHSELGAEDARAFCLHHGLSEYDANLVAWLVKNHLQMSTTAQRRDIGDPLVVNEFAQIVGNRVRLDYLYLLTVADIRATNPDLWNSWKDALLMELYAATRRALERGLEHPLDQEEHILLIKAGAGTLLAEEGVPRETVDGVWRHFDDDYFLRHTPDQIAWHTRVIAAQPPASVLLVDVREETGRGGTEIIIYTRADDHLFALTTALLDQLGLTVADARIITTADGYALDTFVVLDESGEPIQSAWRANEIIETLKRELGRSDRRLTSVTRRTPRLLKHFPLPTQVAFSTDKPNQRTVVEIITADRPGLLSQIGRAFNDCGVRLHNARIGTLGSRAEDVFYVTDNRNQPLKDEAQFDCLHDTLVRYLDGTAPAAEKTN